MSFFGERAFTLDRVVRLALSVLTVALLVWALGFFSSVLLPFVVALVFAYLLSPLVEWVQRFVKRRVVAVSLALLVVLAVSAGIVAAVVPVVANELRSTGELLQELFTELDLDRRASQYLPPEIWSRLRALIEKSNAAELLVTNNFWDVLDALAQNIVPELGSVVSGVASVLLAVIGLLVILLYLLFLLNDFEKIQQGYPKLIPPQYRERVLVMIREFELAMSRYFRAQLLIVFIEMVLFSVAYWAIGLPLGFVFGLLLGFLGIVPYLQTVGLVVPGSLLVVLHALRGGDFGQMLVLVLIVFAAVILLQEIYLVPRFQGKATGLSPAMIFLSLSLWGQLLGILGLIIALPMTYLIVAYYKQFIARQEERESDEDEFEEEEEQLSYS